MARRRYQKGSLVPNRGIPTNGLWVGRWREDVIQPDGTITRPYKWVGPGNDPGLPYAETRAACLGSSFVYH